MRISSVCASPRRRALRSAALVAAVALFAVATGSARAEHGPEEPSGIVLAWVTDALKNPSHLDDPLIDLRLTNLDDVFYAVSLTALEDHGDLQSRRVGREQVAFLPPKGTIDLPVRFAAKLPRRLTHSGLVVAQLTACPADGRTCLNGASEPLFFHPKKRGVLVYGERLLCKRFRCGDLRGRGKPTRGTWRVMGGGPLHQVADHEERSRNRKRNEDRVVVEGGDR